MRYIAKLLLTLIVIFFCAPAIDVRGQLGDASFSREEFAKPRVLRFEFIDITRTRFKSKELSGKIIVIDCWATWCRPCQKSLPELSAIKRKFDDRIAILGISFDKSIEDLKDYMKEDDVGRGIDYPIVFGPHLLKFWDDVGVLPTTFLIDKGGRLRCRYRGYTPQAQLETDISKLLAEK